MKNKKPICEHEKTHVFKYQPKSTSITDILNNKMRITAKDNPRNLCELVCSDCRKSLKFIYCNIV